jgi:hypothetical protein
MATLHLRFIGGVDDRLKAEVMYVGKWLRGWYAFPNRLEIRLVNQRRLVDFDGTKCALRWWQSSIGTEPVTAEIAVGTFAENLESHGEDVAFPTVIAAVGRALKYYHQQVRGSPNREDYAERWGDQLLNAYCDGLSPPPPWKGAWANRGRTDP